MRKTYITNMPDKAGAFLTATKVITEAGGNIVRVNYNRAVDTHTLLIEVEADEEQQKLISRRLEEVKYLVDDPGMRQIILIELVLPDRPGALLPALEVIKNHEVNIPYINSQENGTPYQNFKLGLLVENTAEIKDLLDELSQICEVRVLDYEVTDRLLDSTIFYVTFANKLRELLGLSQDETNGALSSANKVMQVLDKRHESPRKAFDAILRFADLVALHRGDRFTAKVSSRRLDDELMLHIIEPPIGGNTYILEYYEALLFIDCGLGCFKAEMAALLDKLFPGFDARRKSIVLTQADVDAAGLGSMFDTVYLVRDSYDNFAAEQRGRGGLRERKASNAPFVALSKIVSNYAPPQLGHCAVIGERQGDDPLEFIGSIRFGNWFFEVCEGAGGHVAGETVIACPELRIVFTGDLLANREGMTAEQLEYESLQPYLMTSYDANPALAAACREELAEKYAGYTILPGCGPAVWRD